MTLAVPARFAVKVIFAWLLIALVFSAYVLHDYHGFRRNTAPPFDVADDFDPLFNDTRHRKIYSLSTSDRKWFKIDWGSDFLAYNPNIIPHPTKLDTYIVTAMQVQQSDEMFSNVELACNAAFVDGALKCIDLPKALPIELVPGYCTDDLAYFNFRPGPRDARMFHGPDAPYIMYGSLATHNCLGMFLQDLRMLVDDYSDEREKIGHDPSFANGTELQRPPPYGDVQKNWFVFWDAHDEIHVHQDIYPNRTYQKLSVDGSVGPELSIQARPNDETCMANFMPKKTYQEENVHQSTNSLSVTLCKRSDRDCLPNDDNTFIMTLFHYQTFWDWHAQYYPYVILFKRTSPFEIHAISQKSLWVHGKPLLTAGSDSGIFHGDSAPEGHTELFYATSVNWKNHGNRYHGFIDDPLFITFGIEDIRCGGIDILAGDLLQDLALCAEAT